MNLLSIKSALDEGKSIKYSLSLGDVSNLPFYTPYLKRYHPITSVGSSADFNLFLKGIIDFMLRLPNADDLFIEGNKNGDYYELSVRSMI